ncbi:hypothetical protein NLX67_15550 [Domibacillus sp. A3M-37]|uniref:hypothetical protein n=1 Tax=Domibacillus sp. A3M-37 TaxID=2962037 RepID=UPI0020B8458C|nr:hypothetical protein [Domibacillus sp. A3M-37]MCP3763789.1 hypothetical protein [Domibacillus sp. A3M-37]
MNSANSYLELHKEYLLSISGQNRPGEINQFEVIHLDLQGWLQKGHGLSPAQAKAVIEDSKMTEEVA